LLLLLQSFQMTLHYHCYQMCLNFLQCPHYQRYLYFLNYPQYPKFLHYLPYQRYRCFQRYQRVLMHNLQYRRIQQMR
jgi:hypothetical protein